MTKMISAALLIAATLGACVATSSNAQRTNREWRQAKESDGRIGDPIESGP
jgi:hypothetical protein